MLFSIYISYNNVILLYNYTVKTLQNIFQLKKLIIFLFILFMNTVTADEILLLSNGRTIIGYQLKENQLQKTFELLSPKIWSSMLLLQHRCSDEYNV